MRGILSILLILLLIGSGWTSYEIHKESEELIQHKEDQAEINRIGYGILSVNAWKDQVSAILTKKIDEFELNDDNRAEFQKTVEQALHRLLDEVAVVLENNKKKSLWDRIKGETMGLFFDIQQFRKDIPRFSKAILEELDKQDTKSNLKEFIRGKLDEFTEQTGGVEDFSSRIEILASYQQESIESCTEFLDSEIVSRGSRIEEQSYWMILAVILGFLFWWWVPGDRTRLSFFLLILLSMVPLYSGVSTPMLDIDARISHFEFQFLGDSLAFSNQVLYFQSKSILDVVEILVRQGNVDSTTVGILVMMFSIIFPLIKLLSTALVEMKPNLLKNPIIRFFVLKSAKWSMADVLVVSIFMSFIGFKGVIDSQLGQLDRSSDKLDIITTDNTALQTGFLLFLTFTVAGLVLSSIAEKRFSPEP